MAEVIVTVPDAMERRRWVYNAGAVLAAGNDVLFKDSAGNEIDVPMLNVGIDATMVCRPAGAADHTKQSLKFANGGWHINMCAKYFAGGSTASNLARVRFDA